MIENIKNNIDFFLRNLTKFSRKNYVEKNYEIIKANNARNMYMYDILFRYFKQTTQKDKVKLLDIGCKNWYYAKGQYDFLKSFCPVFQMDGVEVDAYRLYANFYSRYEVAKYYIKNLENTNYINDDLLNIKEKYDYITWFLPFVTIKPLKIWGLPMKYFCPEKMLNHAYFLLKSKGQMLIVNQGEKEVLIQKELLEKLELEYDYLGEIKSDFFEYANKRFGFLISKD